MLPAAVHGQASAQHFLLVHPGGHPVGVSLQAQLALSLAHRKVPWVVVRLTRCVGWLDRQVSEVPLGSPWDPLTLFRCECGI